VPVVGDLADLDRTRDAAEQVNRLGRTDAVIHNAGVYTGRTILPVNVIAPYLLTALINRPQRLVYLSSDMHHGGRADLAGMDWSGRSVTGSSSDGKLFVATRRRRSQGVAERGQQRRRPRLPASARRPRC
jgi:NAD(P)-dependent dehydrogenase (short-subunit alcohol dehydrogenase family)